MSWYGGGNAMLASVSYTVGDGAWRLGGTEIYYGGTCKITTDADYWYALQSVFLFRLKVCL